MNRREFLAASAAAAVVAVVDPVSIVTSPPPIGLSIHDLFAGFDRTWREVGVTTYSPAYLRDGGYRQ